MNENKKLVIMKKKKPKSEASSELTSIQKRIEGLQRRPGCEKLRDGLDEVLINLLDNKKLSKDTLGKWAEIEHPFLMHLLDLFMDQLGGNQREDLYQKIEEVLDEDTKEKIRQREQINIENALDCLIAETNRFPARLEISTRTGYNLAVIDKHMSDYISGRNHERRKEELIVMRERLLSRCYNLARAGNMKAMQLFLDATGKGKNGEEHVTATIRNQLNNFVQFDNLIITRRK